jgi:hypothetical protein
LKRLTKLFIGGNCISRVEGLSGLTQLQELHIENQKLKIGDELTFEPESVQAIANSLQVLDVSGNGLTTLFQFSPLTQLVLFNASDNNIFDLSQLVHLLGSSWRKLKQLDLTSNPVSRLRRYRDRVVVLSSSLETLDGKEISEIERVFLKNWKAARHTSLKQTAPLAEPVVPVPASQPELMSLVPSTSLIVTQRFYYDSATESVREWQTPSKAVRPSLVQLPELPEGSFQKTMLARSVSNPCYRSLVASRERKENDNRFLNCSGVRCYEKTKRASSFHVG